MFISRVRFRVQWGDCDPANIVFYPQYLRWFDECASALFRNAGLTLPELFREHEVVGIPIVDLKVKFLISSGFEDELAAESQVLEWRRSSFLLRHRFFKADALAVEGVETRVWTAIDPNDRSRMKSQPLPRIVVEKLSLANAAGQ
jgi:4-hydroxybenzoyl-CoA thioesterase